MDAQGISTIGSDNHELDTRRSKMDDFYEAENSSMLHNLLFKAIFGQDYPNLGRLCNMLENR